MKTMLLFLFQLIAFMLSFGFMFYWFAFNDYLMMILSLLTFILAGYGVVTNAKEISKKS